MVSPAHPRAFDIFNAGRESGIFYGLAARLAVNTPFRRTLRLLFSRPVRSLRQLALLDAMSRYYGVTVHEQPNNRPVDTDGGQGAALALAFAAGNFSGCTVRPQKAGKLCWIDAPLRLAGQIWTNGDARPITSSPGGDFTIVLMPGAHGAAILPLLDMVQSAKVIAFPGSKGLERLSESHRQLQIQSQSRTDFGFSRPWYPASRKAAENIISQFSRTCDDAEAQAEIQKHKLALVNKLNLDLIADISAAEDLAKTLQSEVGRKILIVEGHQSAQNITEALKAYGHKAQDLFATCGSWQIFSRLNFVRRRSEIPELDAILNAATNRALNLSQTIKAFRAGLKFPAARDAAIIIADFRNSGDFRYLPTAAPMVSRLAKKRRVRILQQRNSFSNRLLNLMIASALRPGDNQRISLLPSHHALKWPYHAHNWAIPMGDLAAVIAQDPDIASIVGLPAVLPFTVQRFASEYLAQGLALASACEAAARRAKPAYAIVIPDTQPFSMALTSGLRAAGVPTLAVQTLMIGQSDRDCHPIAEWVACIDDVQQELYNQRFGIPLDRLVPVGNVEMDEWKQALAGQPLHRKGPLKRIIYVSQPLPGLSETALTWVVDAVAGWDDCELLVFTHPGEDKTSIEKYAGIIAAANAPDRIRIAGSGTPPDEVMAADVLVNIVSNVAYKAGALGKRVLVVDPTENGLPVRFHEMGIAVAARGLQETRDVLRKLVDGHLDATLDEARSSFYSRNSHYSEGTAIERLAALASRLTSNNSTNQEC